MHLPPYPAGDRWFENSCYASVVLQLFLAHPTVVYAILWGFCVGGTPTAFRKGSVLSELHSVVLTAWQIGRARLVEPARVAVFTLCRLREAVATASGKAGYSSTDGSMQDPLDFLWDLLAAVNEEACQLQVDGASPWFTADYSSIEDATDSRPRDPLLDQFLVVSHATIRCCGCGNETHTYSHALCWEADVGSSENVPHSEAEGVSRLGREYPGVPLGSLMSRSERMTGVDQYQCDAGRVRRQDADRTYRPAAVGAGPPILLVRLGGRFTASDGSVQGRVHYLDRLECLGLRHATAVVRFLDDHYTAKAEHGGNVYLHDGRRVTPVTAAVLTCPEDPGVKWYKHGNLLQALADLPK